MPLKASFNHLKKNMQKRITSRIQFNNGYSKLRMKFSIRLTFLNEKLKNMMNAKNLTVGKGLIFDCSNDDFACISGDSDG